MLPGYEHDLMVNYLPRIVLALERLAAEFKKYNEPQIMHVQAKPDIAHLKSLAEAAQVVLNDDSIEITTDEIAELETETVRAFDYINDNQR